MLAGKKITELKSELSSDIICPKCDSTNTTRVIISGIYKHFFQIPFISGGKTGKSICKNCNTTFELSTMPPNIKLAYYELKENVKTPFWFYTGVIVIKTLVLIKIFSKYI